LKDIKGVEPIFREHLWVVTLHGFDLGFHLATLLVSAELGVAMSNLFHEANSQGPNRNVPKNVQKKKDLAPWSALFLGLA